jgi:hypothetical protein
VQHASTRFKFGLLSHTRLRLSRSDILPFRHTVGDSFCLWSTPRENIMIWGILLANERHLYNTYGASTGWSVTWLLQAEDQSSALTLSNHGNTRRPQLGHGLAPKTEHGMLPFVRATEQRSVASRQPDHDRQLKPLWWW